MLHLIFSLPHAWGGTTHSGTLPLLFDSRDFSVGSSLSPHNDFHFAPRSEIVALLRMMFLMLCVVFAAAGPGNPGVGDVFSMGPTMTDGAVPHMLPSAADGGAGFVLGGWCSTLNFMSPLYASSIRSVTYFTSINCDFKQHIQNGFNVTWHTAGTHDC